MPRAQSHHVIVPATQAAPSVTYPAGAQEMRPARMPSWSVPAVSRPSLALIPVAQGDGELLWENLDNIQLEDGSGVLLLN